MGWAQTAALNPWFLVGLVSIPMKEADHAGHITIINPASKCKNELELKATDAKGKMKIGIIGTGQIGSVLTRQFTRLGHDVVMANSRGPETLEDLAKATGAKPVHASEVPRGRDLVVVTIPEGKIQARPERKVEWRATANSPGTWIVPK